MRIQHNIMAMNAYRNLGMNNKSLSGNLEKLSSGYKINRAGDDAAGLAISEKMRAQITALDAAQKNVNDGISLVKTAEGAMQEIQDMLNRMEYLATQSANGTYDNDVDRTNLQKEVTALKSEINRIADASNFNGTKLLDGSLASPALEQTTAGAVVGATGDDDTAAVYAFDFGELTGADVIGGTVKIGSTTYEFVETGAEYTGSNTKIEVDVDADAGEIVDQLMAGGGTAPTDTNYNLADGGTKITFTEKKVDDNAVAAAPVVEQSGLGGLKLQIGDTSDSYNQIKVQVGDMHTTAMGTDSANTIDGVDISTQTGAADAVKVIKDAINYVSSVRGDLGAVQNRLEHTNNNLAVMEENIQDAESTIRDTDIADEMMAYTKNNILIQSAQAMLAQANQVPQGVLQLMQ